MAKRFGYRPGYVSQLRHQFQHSKIDFSEPPAEGRIVRYKISAIARQKIIEWQQKLLSASEIAALLAQEGNDASVRTVERALAEEGFLKPPRRTQHIISRTAKGASVPAQAESASPAKLEGRRMESSGACVFCSPPSWPGGAKLTTQY